MERQSDKTLVQLLFCGIVLILVGCETTDYEPLEVKQLLRDTLDEMDELKEEVDDLKKQLAMLSSNSHSPAELQSEESASTDSDDSGSESTEKEPDGDASNSAEPEVSPEVEQGVRSELENSDVYFELDDQGYVIEADLIECVDPDAVGKLTTFPRLSKVFLDGNSVTPETFDTLAELKNLSHLEMERCVLSGESVGKLAGA